MRIFHQGLAAEVNLVDCERGDPCAYDHTCRIHQLYGFLKRAGLVAERSSVERPTIVDVLCQEIEQAQAAAKNSSGLPVGFPRECEFGRID